MISVKYFLALNTSSFFALKPSDWSHRHSHIKKNDTWKEFFLSLGTHTIILFVTALVVFHNNRAGLFVGFDGTFFRSLIKNQFEWGTFSSSLQSTPLWGLGSLPWVWNTHFSLAYVLSSYFTNGECIAPLCYALISVEFFISTCLLCRCLNLNTNIGILSGWLGVATAMPFFWPCSLYAFSGMVPHLLESHALMCLALGTFYVIGKGSLPLDIFGAILSLFSTAILLIVNSIFIMIFAPAMLFYGALFLGMAESKKELLHKCAFLSLCIIIAALSGFAPWITGYFLQTSSTFFLPEWHPAEKTLYTVSIFYHQTINWVGGREVYIGAILGGITLLFSKEKKILKFSIGSLLAFLLLLLGGTILLRTLNDSAPNNLYFEMGFWPFYFIFFAIFIFTTIHFLQKAVATFISKRRAVFFLSKYSSHFLALTVAIAACLLSFKSSGVQSYPYPIKETSITTALKEEIGLEKNKLFRGSVANFTCFHTKPQGITWSDQHADDQEVILKYSNDHRGPALWYYNIPTLFEYTQIMTPAYYLLVSRLLMRDQDQTVRNVVVLSKINFTFLRSLGVKYLITDFIITSDAVLRKTMLISEKTTLYLYEINNVNTGNYSPTKVIIAQTASKTLQYIQSPQFDFQNQVILEKDIEDTLSPAENTSITYERNGIRVKGTSTGKSLLLLPLQYSRCIKVTGQSPEKIKLVRANMLLTGVFFDKEIDVHLSLRYGPFENSWGKLLDFEDMKKLNLKEVCRFR